jgi:branched-chain amino acid transport system permease protein
LRPRKLVLAILAVGLVILVLPTMVNSYVGFILNLVLVYVLVSVGNNLLLGHLGQLAFSSAAYFGMGAYAVAISMGRFGLSFLAALVVGAVISGVAGFLLGLPALRLKRYSLALMTLAFVELMRWIYIHADAWTHGSAGIPVPPADILGFTLDTEARKYWVFLVIVAASLLSTISLLRSRIGRAWVAVRENELAAASVGVWPAWYKVLAFAWSSVLLGVAGGMFALLVGRVVPESFGLSELLLHFTMVMVGGLGSLMGAVLGAMVITAIPELLRNLPGLSEIVFSLFLMTVLLFSPRGIAGVLERRWPFLRESLVPRKAAWKHYSMSKA